MATRLKNKLATAEEQVRAAYRNGATLREIGEVHGVSAGTVRNKLIELGEEMRPRGRRKKEVDTEQRALPTAELPTEPTSDSTELRCEGIAPPTFDPTPGVMN